MIKPMWEKGNSGLTKSEIKVRLTCAALTGLASRSEYSGVGHEVLAKEAVDLAEWTMDALDIEEV